MGGGGEKKNRPLHLVFLCFQLIKETSRLRTNKISIQEQTDKRNGAGGDGRKIDGEQKTNRRKEGSRNREKKHKEKRATKQTKRATETSEPKTNRRREREDAERPPLRLRRRPGSSNEGAPHKSPATPPFSCCRLYGLTCLPSFTQTYLVFHWSTLGRLVLRSLSPVVAFMALLVYRVLLRVTLFSIGVHWVA